MIVVSHVEDRAKALSLGAKVSAQKPINPGWLVSELDRLTRTSEHAEEVRG